MIPVSFATVCGWCRAELFFYQWGTHFREGTEKLENSGRRSVMPKKGTFPALFRKCKHSQTAREKHLHSTFEYITSMCSHSPVYTGDINDDINHIAAQLVGLHVDRGTVCGYVDFTDHVKQKGFFYPWILKKEKYIYSFVHMQRLWSAETYVAIKAEVNTDCWNS